MHERRHEEILGPRAEVKVLLTIGVIYSIHNSESRSSALPPNLYAVDRQDKDVLL